MLWLLKRLRVVLVPVLVLSAAACQTVEDVPPSVINTWRPAPLIRADDARSRTTGPNGTPLLDNTARTKTTFLEGSGRFIGEPPTGAIKPTTEAAADGVTINLVNVPALQAAKTVLGVRYTDDLGRSKSMGITAVVFEEGSAPADVDIWAWITAQRKAHSHGQWLRPDRRSIVLNLWFRDMQKTFPLLADADPDDSHGTEYSFYEHFVYIVFAGSVGDEGVVTAWKLADKYELRMLVGDEFLPRTAPEGERSFHITALDGSKAQSTGTRNVCIAILDPSAPASGVQKWVFDHVNIDKGSDDPSSIKTSGNLKQWNDAFRTLDLGCVHLEAEFFQKITLVRTRSNDLHKVAPAAIELAKKFRLELLFIENI